MTSKRHTTAILTIILVSCFMILLDNSVIFTALPSLQAGLGLSSSELAWVQDAYTLVFGGLLLLGARAGDLLGRRRVFVFGLAVFSIASLLIAVAPAAWWIIAAPSHCSSRSCSPRRAPSSPSCRCVSSAAASAPVPTSCA
jgi:MFS family permease